MCKGTIAHDAAREMSDRITRTITVMAEEWHGASVTLNPVAAAAACNVGTQATAVKAIMALSGLGEGTINNLLEEGAL